MHTLRRPSKTKRASKLFETLWRCYTCVSWDLGTKAGARFVWDILTKRLWLSMFHLNYTPGFRFDRLKGEYINVEDDWISGEISKSLMGKIVCHFWPTHSKTFFPTHLVDRSQLIFYLVPVPQDFHSQAGSTTHLGENVMAITAASQARTTSRQRPLWVRCTPALLPDNPLPSEEKNYRMCNVLVM